MYVTVYFFNKFFFCNSIFIIFVFVYIYTQYSHGPNKTIGRVDIPIGQCINNYLQRKYQQSFGLVSIVFINLYQICNIKRNYVKFEIDSFNCK